MAYYDQAGMLECSYTLSVNTSIWDMVNASEQSYNSFLKDTEFVIADTETTGFNGEIIELGAVIVKNKCVRMKDGSFLPFEQALKQMHNVDFFGALIYPTPIVDHNGNKSYYLSPIITQITNISLDLMDRSKGAPMPNSSFESYAEPFQMFLDFCGERMVVGHNWKFDIGRFRAMIEEFRTIEIFEKVKPESLENFINTNHIDSYKDAKSILIVNSEPNLKNATLARKFGVVADENTLHRAYYDAFFTGVTFYGLLEKARQEYVEVANMLTVV